MQDINAQWFGLSSGSSTAAEGGQVVPLLYALHHCKHSLVLQLDCDLLLNAGTSQGPAGSNTSVASETAEQSGVRGGTCSTPSIHAHSRANSQVAAMTNLLQGDQRALTVSLDICPASLLSELPGGSSAQPPLTFCSPEGRPWRVEVRGCMLHRERLELQIPLLVAAVQSHGGDKARPPLWHRWASYVVCMIVLLCNTMATYKGSFSDLNEWSNLH